jgi:flagellar hook-basal body complex protein FliE
MAIPAAAAAAYQAMSKIGAEATATPGITPADLPSSGPNFGDFHSEAIKDSTSTLKAGEQAATSGIAGKSNIVDVVNAVNSAEITLDTVVAVRDKVVAAYQSIMNMPI